MVVLLPNQIRCWFKQNQRAEYIGRSMCNFDDVLVLQSMILYRKTFHQAAATSYFISSDCNFCIIKLLVNVHIGTWVVYQDGMKRNIS